MTTEASQARPTAASLLAHLLVQRALGRREDHPHGDQQEDDAARGGERRRRDVEHVEQVFAGEEEADHDGECDQQIAHDDAAVSLGRDVAKRREEQRNVAEWVHDEEEQNGGGEQGHVTGRVRRLLVNRKSSRK